MTSSSASTSAPSTNLIMICSTITFILAVANRVLYKLALVPMKNYPFFLAQFTTFGYVAVYFSILYGRYQAGIVTDEMLKVPKSRFMAIGALEAIGVAAGMSSTAMLPGPSIPILNQVLMIIVMNYAEWSASRDMTFLVWQLMFSTIILGRKYSITQIIGCLLVAVGVVVAVASNSIASQLGKIGSNSRDMLNGVEILWPALMIVSSAFQAAASILKEFVFIDGVARLKGKTLDIFVVNSFGSGFQALFVLLFLPFLSNLKGIPFTELPSFLRSGAACFLNFGINNAGCDGAPLLPLLYIITNMAFNISLPNLVKISTAVVSSLAVILSVPIAIYVLSLPLPYLPDGSSLSPFFILGSAILVLGLVFYNLQLPAKQDSKIV